MLREDLAVLRALSEGRSVPEVAAMLGVSEHAIARRLSRIRHELGASNTVAAVVVAVRRGLI